jgi:hypothetical protein
MKVRGGLLMVPYSNGIWMRVDAVNDLSLLKMEPESWDLACAAR